MYDVEHIYEENTDIENIQLNTNIAKINEYIENYKSNTLPSEQNNYASLYSELNPSFTPFSRLLVMISKRNVFLWCINFSNDL